MCCAQGRCSVRLLPDAEHQWGKCCCSCVLVPRPVAPCYAEPGRNPVVRPTSGVPMSWRSVPKGCPEPVPGDRRQPGVHHDIREMGGCQSSSGMMCCEIARIRSSASYSTGIQVLGSIFRLVVLARPWGPFPVLCPCRLVDAVGRLRRSEARRTRQSLGLIRQWPVGSG